MEIGNIGGSALSGEDLSGGGLKPLGVRSILKLLSDWPSKTEKLRWHSEFQSFSSQNFIHVLQRYDYHEKDDYRPRQVILRHELPWWHWRFSPFMISCTNDTGTPQRFLCFTNSRPGHNENKTNKFSRPSQCYLGQIRLSHPTVLLVSISSDSMVAYKNCYGRISPSVS